MSDEPFPKSDGSPGGDSQSADSEPTAGGSRALLGSSAVMAVGTMASRITGVGRDIAAAAALGFYLVADAFSLGNSLPNILYILIVGGALNAVFIPQLVRKMKEDDDDGRAYADRLLTLAGVVLISLALLATLLAPWIVDLYTPADYPPGEFELAVAFARLCLPQILFYGIYTMLSQVLNARGKFGAPMFAPIANNVVAISTFLLFIAVAGTGAAADGVLTSQQVLILGIGTTLGVLVQALILIPVLRGAGYHFTPRFDWRGSGLGRAGGLALWTIGLVLVNQLTYIVVTRLATQANVNALASDAVAAGLTTYQKAHLVFVLPHSVITVSIVTALLPALSRLAHDGKLRQVGHDVGASMRLVSALIVPVAAVLVACGASIAILLFGYGAATNEQAGLMGLIVSVFMIGLLPFTLFYVLLRGFYALEDTRTPFFITMVFSAAWLVMAVPAFNAAPAGGAQVAMLALTYGLSYWLAMIIAWIVLSRRLGSLDSKRTAWTVTRMAAAGIVSAGIMVGVQAMLLPLFADNGKFGLLIATLITAVLGTLAYLALAWLLRVRETGEVVRFVRDRVMRARHV